MSGRGRIPLVSQSTTRRGIPQKPWTARSVIARIGSEFTPCPVGDQRHINPPKTHFFDFLQAYGRARRSRNPRVAPLTTTSRRNANALRGLIPASQSRGELARDHSGGDELGPAAGPFGSGNSSVWPNSRFRRPRIASRNTNSICAFRLRRSSLAQRFNSSSNSTGSRRR